MKNYAVIAGISLAVVLVVGFVMPKAPVVVQELAGAGQTQSARGFFNMGATFGGLVAATTSTAASYTLDAKDFVGAPTVISWLPNIITTVSIGATSTREYIPNVGNVATIYFRNASSTLGTITFVAVDTGVDLQMAEATGGDLVLSGEGWAKLTLIKTATHLVTVIFDEMIEAD